MQVVVGREGGLSFAYVVREIMVVDAVLAEEGFLVLTLNF